MASAAPSGAQGREMLRRRLLIVELCHGDRQMLFGMPSTMAAKSPSSEHQCKTPWSCAFSAIFGWRKVGRLFLIKERVRNTEINPAIIAK
jgi:hypothetical protein